jgi:hypothetical protein
LKQEAAGGIAEVSFMMARAVVFMTISRSALVLLSCALVVRFLRKRGDKGVEARS